MISLFAHRPLLLLLLGLAAGGAARLSAAPALVVVVSIDQFRYDYLERFRRHFEPGGFNLFLEQGANFANCHYRHSNTKTGPGHAVMLTGTYANKNGIIGNDWLDRDTLVRVSCVGDTAVKVVGLPPSAAPRLPGIDDPYLGRSPKYLLVDTVGDELKRRHGGRPKVIGISNKHRSAILMSGRQANAAYYMEKGRMVTSTYYMTEVPPWVQQWNDAGKAEAYFGRQWDRLLPVAEYEAQGPDDAPGEDVKTGALGCTMPKLITGGLAAPGTVFYQAFDHTPFASEVLADFAQAAIEHENLGGREGITDLLCVSFSANDLAGHLYGPDSHEVMDLAVRTDRILARFFEFLDRRIGLRKCLLVLTADHGVAPMPERIHATSPETPAGRVDLARVLAAGEQALTATFGPLADDSNWVVRDDAWLLIFPAALREKNVEPAAAQAVVRDALLRLDFVQAAYTRDQLEKGAVTDELGRQALLSFSRPRSGDVVFQFKRYYFNRATGSTHGAPYDYDTHVPLLWFGAGVKPGMYRERVGVDDIAPTLTHLLGLPDQPLAEGRKLF